MLKEQVENLIRWRDALKSGNYEQTRHCLKNSKGYCCLGVLLDILEPEGWMINRHFSHKNSFQLSTSIKPDYFKEKTGLGSQEVFIQLNDSSGNFDPVIAYINGLLSQMEPEQ